MRKKNRSFLLMALLTASLLVSMFTIVQAQSPAVKASKWSDPATWPDKKVPGKDALVTIGRDMNVVLDVTPPALHGLTINGKLSFADNKDLELTTEWIMVHGELEIGTEAKPPHTQGDHHPHRQRQRRRFRWMGGTRTAVTAGSCSWAEPSIFTVTGPIPGRSCPAQRTPAPPRSRS